MIENALKEFIQACPKAEVHYHIDCISKELFIKFANRNGMELPFSNEEEMNAFYDFRSLEGFLKAMLLSIDAIQKEEDFVEMVVECAADMKRQNIIYREAMFDYTGCYGRRGISLDTVITGFAKGLKIAKEQFGEVDIRFIANLDRTNDVNANCAYLQELVKYKAVLPIIAVGMDMAEIGYPARNQKKAFELARSYGFHLTGHNGEDLGAQSVWEALDTLGLERVDHGVRSVEDSRLLKYLADRQIMLTLCPDSNISLGVYPEWEKYPLRELMKSGVKICINSDDPGVLHYDLNGNFIKCTEVFKLTKEEIVELIRNSFIYNFEGKEHLNELEEWLETH